MDAIGDAILDAIQDIFLPTPFYNWAEAIWTFVLTLIGMNSRTTPQAFSSEAWSLVTDSVYPFMTMLGATLLNIFFMVGVIRQCDNLRQNITLEMMVELLIKAVIANGLLLSGMALIEWCFGLAGDMAGLFYQNGISFTMEEHDLGTWLADWTLGVIYMTVALICSVLLFLTVYGRYLQLYLMAAVYPVAMSTLPGGNGLEQTAFAWIRAFLSKVFSIVIIALTVALASKMYAALDFLSTDLPVLNGLDGFTQYIQNMFTMILLAATVKGVDIFMKKAFNI